MGAARFIEIPSATTINGTKIKPPPTPKRLDIIPAKKLAPAEKTSRIRDVSKGFPSIFLFRKMYDADAKRTSANKILKISGDKSEDMNAPSTVPGTAINPSFQPSESSMRFCLAYTAVDAEVFRGALRPFATTVNQELSDVLKSNVRVFLILPGTVDGKEPNDENIVNTINYLMSDEAASSSEVIFCPDETR